MKIVEMENVTFGYHPDEIIFKALNLSISENEKIVIWGKSGSGKSTLLQLLGGILKPLHGKVSFNNLNSSQMAWSFQDPLLINELTVEENILLNVQEMVNYQKEMERLGIKDLSDLKALYLSGGEKQRVALTRAIANNPKLLMVDEPTAMVDQPNKEIIVEFLKNYTGSVVISTHDPTFRSIDGTHYQITNQGINKIEN